MEPLKLPKGTDFTNLRLNIVKVIKVQYYCGAGTTDDHSREITEFYDTDGNLIVRVDPCSESTNVIYYQSLAENKGW